MADRTQLPDISTVSTTVADDDLIVKRNTATGEDEQCPISVLRDEGFGSAAAEDVGTDIGDVVQLEDVGGSPALPAVSAEQLTDFPSGMNINDLTYNAPITLGGNSGFGHQFGVDDVSLIEIDFLQWDEYSHGLFITDPVVFDAKSHGISFEVYSGDSDVNILADNVVIGSENEVAVAADTVRFQETGIGIENVDNLSYVVEASETAFNTVDFNFKKIASITLTEDLTISTFSNLLEVGSSNHIELILIIEQGYGGGFNINGWPANVSFESGEPDISYKAEGEISVIRFHYDGTTLHGSYELTASNIKTMYESNADTNAFTDTDAERVEKLDLITVNNPINLDTLSGVVGQGLLFYGGTWDASTGSFPFDEYLYGGYGIGAVFVVSASGAVDGVSFNEEDLIVAIINEPSEDTYAGNWNRIPGRISLVQNAGPFWVSANATPDMKFNVGAGSISLYGTTTNYAAQDDVATLVAPVSLSRKDRVVVDLFTGAKSVVAGTEAASPVAPDVPPGKVAAATITLATTTTAITDDLIENEFPVIVGDPVFITNILSQTKTGWEQNIVCYGDSNTRYYDGDSSTAGPYSYSYGAWLDYLCTFNPHLYKSVIDIAGFPGQTSSYGVTNFSTNVPAGTDILILGFGTNNIKVASPDIGGYLSDMEQMMDDAIALGSVIIVLGIPWFYSGYGANGAASQALIPVWNSSLCSLCLKKGAAFIDTYSITKEYPGVYLNEASQYRHYSTVATHVIAERILDATKILCVTSEDARSNIKDFNDISFITANTFDLVSRDSYANGGTNFNTISIANGHSITIAGAGRGCFAFYPVDSCTLTITTSTETINKTITPAVDNGSPYLVDRAGLNASHTGALNDVVIAVTSGTAHLMGLSFQDGIHNTENIFASSFQILSVSDLPSVGVQGRKYYITELRREGYYDPVLNNYVGPEGLRLRGNSTTRNAVASAPCAVGYRFYNTDGSAVQVWSGSTWVTE